MQDSQNLYSTKHNLLRLFLESGMKREWEHDSITASAIHAMYLMDSLEIEHKFSQITARKDGSLVARAQWDEYGVVFTDYICSNPHIYTFLEKTIETCSQLREELPLTMKYNLL